MGRPVVRDARAYSCRHTTVVHPMLLLAELCANVCGFRFGCEHGSTARPRSRIGSRSSLLYTQNSKYVRRARGTTQNPNKCTPFILLFRLGKVSNFSLHNPISRQPEGLSLRTHRHRIRARGGAPSPKWHTAVPVAHRSMTDCNVQYGTLMYSESSAHLENA